MKSIHIFNIIKDEQVVSSCANIHFFCLSDFVSVILSTKKRYRWRHRFFDLFCFDYFSILILASTATTAVEEPKRGFKSISAISGAACTNADTLAIWSA